MVFYRDAWEHDVTHKGVDRVHWIDVNNKVRVVTGAGKARRVFGWPRGGRRWSRVVSRLRHNRGRARVGRRWWGRAKGEREPLVEKKREGGRKRKKEEERERKKGK